MDARTRWSGAKLMAGSIVHAATLGFRCRLGQTANRDGVDHLVAQILSWGRAAAARKPLRHDYRVSVREIVERFNRIPLPRFFRCYMNSRRTLLLLLMFTTFHCNMNFTDTFHQYFAPLFILSPLRSFWALAQYLGHLK